MQYDFAAIEKKWQDNWEKTKPYRAVTGDKTRKKFYGLIEFPYPSAAGLHVGHPRPFTAIDVVTRKKRMEGYNVLFPIGFDAFGLPTENFAIKNHIHPAVVTQENIKNFTRQLKMLGYGFDWDRCVDTTDPKYYKWTQWIFLQLYNPRYGLLTLIVQWFRPEFKESILLIQPQNFWAMTLAYILFQGTASIMLLGQISSVPQEVYEAAKIDGATGFKLDWYITIPCIRDMIKTVVILTVTGGFMLYNEVYFLTKGAAGTTSLAYILRELSVVSSRMQYARANVIGVVQIVGGLLLIGIINLLFKIDLSVPLRKIALWRSRHEEKKQNP